MSLAIFEGLDIKSNNHGVRVVGLRHVYSRIGDVSIQ